MDGGPTSTRGLSARKGLPCCPPPIPTLQAGGEEPPCPDPGDEVMAEAMPCGGDGCRGHTTPRPGPPRAHSLVSHPIPDPTGVPSIHPKYRPPLLPPRYRLCSGWGRSGRVAGTNMALLAVAEVMAALDTTPHLVHFSSRLPQGGGFELRAHHPPGTPRPGAGHAGGGRRGQQGRGAAGGTDGWTDGWMDVGRKQMEGEKERERVSWGSRAVNDLQRWPSGSKEGPQPLSLG